MDTERESFIKTLPEGYAYSVKSLAGTGESYTAKVYASIKDTDDMHKWIEKYSGKSATNWSVRRTYPGLKHNSRKDYVCHFNDYHHRVKTTAKNISRYKDTGCPATISIKIKVVSRSTIRSYKWVRDGMAATVSLMCEHNHAIRDAHALSFRRVHPKVREKFIEYFNAGMSVMAARAHHSQQLDLYPMGELSTFARCDAALTPSAGAVYKLYTEWRIRNGVERRKNGRKKKLAMTALSANSEIAKTSVDANSKLVTTILCANSKAVLTVSCANSKVSTLAANSEVATSTWCANSKVVALSSLGVNSKVLTTILGANSNVAASTLGVNSKIAGSTLFANSKMATSVLRFNSSQIAGSYSHYDQSDQELENDNFEHVSIAAGLLGEQQQRQHQEFKIVQDDDSQIENVQNEDILRCLALLQESLSSSVMKYSPYCDTNVVIKLLEKLRQRFDNLSSASDLLSLFSSLEGPSQHKVVKKAQNYCDSINKLTVTADIFQKSAVVSSTKLSRIYSAPSAAKQYIKICKKPGEYVGTSVCNGNIQSSIQSNKLN